MSLSNRHQGTGDSPPDGKRGVINQFFAAAPPCSLSLTGLLTGRYPLLVAIARQYHRAAGHPDIVAQMQDLAASLDEGENGQ